MLTLQSGLRIKNNNYNKPQLIKIYKVILSVHELTSYITYYDIIQPFSTRETPVNHSNTRETTVNQSTTRKSL